MAVRPVSSHVPSASTFAQDVEEIFSEGFDDFVGKPFKESEIFETIRKYLGVRYVYEEKQNAASRQQERERKEVLTPETLAALPAEWLAALRKGAEEGDVELLFEVIEQIRERDAIVADALVKLAGDLVLLRLMRDKGKQLYLLK